MAFHARCTACRPGDCIRRDRCGNTAAVVFILGPAVAEKLIPKSYPYDTKRQPLDTNYFDTFNKPNVTLVEVNETPIVQFTPAGLRTRDKQYAFDSIRPLSGVGPYRQKCDQIAAKGYEGCALTT